VALPQLTVDRLLRRASGTHEPAGSVNSHMGMPSCSATRHAVPIDVVLGARCAFEATGNARKDGRSRPSTAGVLASVAVIPQGSIPAGGPKGGRPNPGEHWAVGGYLLTRPRPGLITPVS
jgi:hypothetical protein